MRNGARHRLRPINLPREGKQPWPKNDNEVNFAIAGVTEFSFVQTDFSITDGQPYSGVTSSVTQSGAEAQIVVKAGRKGSSEVATWFKNKVGSGQTIVCDTTGTFPDALNFAVEGTMTITTDKGTYTCDNVIIAQGNFATVNNWWMGSPDWQGVHISLGGFTVQKVDFSGHSLASIAVFAPQTPCVNNFSIALLNL